MAMKDLKKCKASLVVRKMQIKMILSWHLIFVRMAKIKNTSDNFAVVNVEQSEYSSVDGGSASLYSHFENQYGGFSEKKKTIYHKNKLYHSWADNQKGGQSYHKDTCSTMFIYNLFEIV